MAKHFKRSRLFIDRPIQLAVIFRTLLYWALCTMAQVLMVLFVAIVTSFQEDFIAHGPQLWWHLEVSLLASAALLPLILFDVLQLSHRWVGPIFRLRACLRSMSRGETVAQVRFRERDFWQDLAGDLNSVAAELERHKAAIPEEAFNSASQAVVSMPVTADSNSDRPSAAVAP